MVKLLLNTRVTKLKIYKSVFISSVISSELFKHSGRKHIALNPGFPFYVLSQSFEEKLERKPSNFACDKVVL